MSDGITKMTFSAFQLMTFSTPKKEPHTISLQLNPKEISMNYSITQNDSGGATGDSTAGMPQFTYVSPSLDIETYVDETGVLNKEAHPLDGETVEQYITKLKAVVYDYIDATHGPPYVKVDWGDVNMSTSNKEGEKGKSFKGQLEKLNITYELFSKTGKPIRAKISMSFKAVTDPAVRPTGQSPDLTHFHQVQIGDNLSMLSNKIYGRPDFYMQLAKVNNLSSVYQMLAGERIIIPPLEKSSR
ncbi:MAG: LysM peptidoglycan-binding domain-containing protein [Saprospiraceae bacterium]|nr:LysM peptidoglycan-binding domain-containing protein [Saprospiraceae bacterium]